MTANSINSNRLANLLRYEFAMHRKLYLIGIPGMLLMTAILFLIIFYSNRYGPNWQQQDYAIVYYAGLFFLTIFGIGYSFIDLRDKSAAMRYLTLPGSAVEKYFIQFLTRIVVFPILFTILFVLGAEVSKHLFNLIPSTIYSKPNTLVIDNLDVIKILPLFYSWKLPVLYYMIFGLGGLIVSLMFAGGIVFGKWNLLLMPVSFIAFGLLLILTANILSWMLVGIPLDGSGLFAPRIDFLQPEASSETPLIFVVSTVVFWLAIPVFFWVAYLKLKEHEV